MIFISVASKHRNPDPGNQGGQMPCRASSDMLILERHSEFPLKGHNEFLLKGQSPRRPI